MTGNTTETQTVRIRVSGRVQGVWYRGWTQENAIGLDLNGWVRNRRDGSVEAVLSGERTAIDAMIGRCHQGPPHARVEKIDVEEFDEELGPGFEIRATI